MYQKPDFVKVSLKISDIFANYGTVGCPMDEYWVGSHTQPCEGTEGFIGEHFVMINQGPIHECYSSLKP